MGCKPSSMVGTDSYTSNGAESSPCPRCACMSDCRLSFTSYYVGEHLLDRYRTAIQNMHQAFIALAKEPTVQGYRKRSGRDSDSIAIMYPPQTSRAASRLQLLVDAISEFRTTFHDVRRFASDDANLQEARLRSGANPSTLFFSLLTRVSGSGEPIVGDSILLTTARNARLKLYGLFGITTS